MIWFAAERARPEAALPKAEALGCHIWVGETKGRHGHRSAVERPATTLCEVRWGVKFGWMISAMIREHRGSSGWPSGAIIRGHQGGHQGQSGVIRVAIRGHPGHSPIPKFCEVALNYLIRVDVDDLAERLRGRSTEVIRGHQRSSGVIRGHQRQSNDFAERLRGRHRNPSQSSTITCGKSTSRKRILYPQMSRCFSVCSRRCDGQSYCTIAT